MAALLKQLKHDWQGDSFWHFTISSRIGWRSWWIGFQPAEAISLTELMNRSSRGKPTSRPLRDYRR